jgi:hypothetical protein
MFLTYFLPIGAMTFTYATVGIELWGSQSIGECTQRQLDNIKSKRKVSLLANFLTRVRCALTVNFLNSGRTYDDGRRRDIHRLLAATESILHSDIVLSTNHQHTVHSRTLSGILLARNEQFNVQSYYLLLDEFKVSPIYLSHSTSAFLYCSWQIVGSGETD